MNWNAFGHSDDEEPPKAWATFLDEDNGTQHVVPLNDSRAHNLGPDCECEPEATDLVADRVVYLTIYEHHAFDGRK